MIPIFKRPRSIPRAPVTLSIKGTQIVGQAGENVVLRGASLYWSRQKPRFYNANTLRWLRDDWNVNAVRAALEVDEKLGAPLAAEVNRVRSVVDAAIDLGLYVLIDWHAHHPYQGMCCEFFSLVANEYRQYPNIIYEIWNEPSGQYKWAEHIKPYHEMVCGVIRAADPKNLIVVGTQNWCRDVEISANDPLSIGNVAYSLHFYAGDHRQPLRDKAILAIKRGLPLLVTEWGACEADGDGPIDRSETARWHRFLESNKIGHINWSISDKNERAAALVPGAPLDTWQNCHLTQSGRLVRSILRNT